MKNKESELKNKSSFLRGIFYITIISGLLILLFFVIVGFILLIQMGL